MTEHKRPASPKPESDQQRRADLAPETHNDEQDEHASQAHEIAAEALALTPDVETPTESRKARKARGDSGLLDDSTQDLIDHMRDMEQSGRIDMSAYRGEPNMDDDDNKYGEGHDPDEDEGDEGGEDEVGGRTPA